MGKRLTVSLCGLALSILAAGCAGGDNANSGNSNAANANANMTSEVAPSPATTGGADGQIVTTQEGTTSVQTRTFANNARVQRVVVRTDAGGRRTAKVYTASGEVRDVPESKIDEALTATGDAVAAAAGVVGDKAEDIGRPVADKAEDIGRGAADKAEDVGRGAVDKAGDAGRVAADKAEDVGGAAVKGAKKVGSKTADGAKKVGGAIKDAVKP